MILIPHILVGAVIMKFMPHNFWIIPMIFFSHYLLDMIPHREYLDMDLSIKKAAWKIFLDFFVGCGLVFYFLGFSWWLILGMICAILPDSPILLYAFRRENKILKSYFNFNDFLHFYALPPVWLGILTQLSVVLIGLILLR